MASVDPLFAQWLQREADWAFRADSAAIAMWGDSAITSSRVTGIATQAAALAEADRELAFLSRGPFGIDIHQLVGVDWQREIGRVVELTIAELDYDAGVDVFVIGAEVDRSTGLSLVTVLRPLRGAL